MSSSSISIVETGARLRSITSDFIQYLRNDNIAAPHDLLEQLLSQFVKVLEILRVIGAPEIDQFLDVTKLKSILSSLNGREYFLAKIFLVENYLGHLLYPSLQHDLTVPPVHISDEFDVEVARLRIFFDMIVSKVDFGATEDALLATGSSESSSEFKHRVGLAISSKNLEFQSILLSPYYITHYDAKHRDTSSIRTLVLWKNDKPGPSLDHRGMPVHYVLTTQTNACTEEDAFASSNDRQSREPIQVEYSASQLSESARINYTVALHQHRLFMEHSNLVAIRSSDTNGQFFIEFVVLCKGFVPIADKEPLPPFLDGIRTRVLSGWVELFGRVELESHRPLLPGAGIAVGVDAKLNLDVEDEKDYSPPVLGTLGGYYSTSGGEVYGVTCANCLQKSKEPTLHENGTYVYQPSALGLIVNAANKMSASKLGEYERVKQRGNFHAMRWLTEELRDDADFTTELSGDAKCGEVIGGVLGALEDNGPVVDVGLVRLDADVLVAERCTPSTLIPASPPLKLYAANARSKILETSAFPDRPFEVYGRGAKSIDTMKAFVDPLDSNIYFRDVMPGPYLTHKCIHAETTKNWEAGDSGTWCWTKEGLIVGMGMAFACIENRGYCCIMPMSNVLAAIEQIIRTV